MGLLATPLLFGSFGACLYGVSCLGELPEVLAFSVYPGTLFSFALIQGHLPVVVVFAAAAFVQFIAYAFLGVIVSILLIGVGL